jgi:peptidoglycan-associated lipoprotein
MYVPQSHSPQREKHMSRKILIVFAASLLILGGCSKGGTKPDESTGAGTGATTGGETDYSSQSGLGAGTVGEGGSYVEPGMQPGDAELITTTVIYFDFDTANIQPQYSEVLSAHARRLVANPDMSVRLEGHADERGSREYNIGLGERRAQAVRQALMLQGVSSVQITTVSYGEERPAATGSDEEAWALNRRVEIIYTE